MARKPKDTIVFKARIERMPGKGGWSFVEFPHDVEQLYGTRAAVRVLGTFNKLPMDRALMPSKSGYHLLIVSAEMRRKARVKEGDEVTIELWRNPEPDELELSEELAETLDFMPEFKAAWEKLTPGTRRGMHYWVSSGKSVETRAKRVAELLRRFESGHPHFGGRKLST
jgi:hypothetical protein